MWYIKRHGLFLEWLIVWLILSGIDAGMAAAFDLPRMEKTIALILAFGIVALPEIQKAATQGDSND